ncbi:thioredoxin family protein [Novosphingobium sp. Gsoil 351]|uniref:DUF1223 domain-containing protein n=1 Tax=Novosphingobium sp. Gsoil 351 TaxID=2675225 RepID=UPI001E44D795|nr:DUF1223 domain-containing protein [Novosphingobium sp. Gsoil 351]
MTLSRFGSLAAIALIGSCSPASDVMAQAGTGGAGPVVVELFQSQGCSSCPPANANVNALAAARSDVIALSYAVTYWDQLGWKDTFAQPAFTERQRAYQRSGQSDGVYTPQVVINGRKALVGTDRGTLNKALAATGPLSGGPTIVRDAGGVTIGAGQGSATVLLVTYDPRVRAVPVKAGENNGRTLPHRNIVTDLHTAGSWNGKRLHIAVPAPKDPALRTVVLIQRGAGGPILAAAKV